MDAKTLFFSQHPDAFYWELDPSTDGIREVTCAGILYSPVLGVYYPRQAEEAYQAAFTHSQKFPTL